MPATPHAAQDADPANLAAPPAWAATLEAIYISPGHDYWTKHGQGRLQHGIRSVAEAHAVADMGLEGDRYFGEKPGGKAQITFLDAAVVDEVRRRFRLKLLPASVFRRNLLVRGVDLSQYLHRRFTFQGITFEGSQECTPCQWMDRAIAPGVQDFLKHPFHGGLRAKIHTTGTLYVDVE